LAVAKAAAMMAAKNILNSNEIRRHHRCCLGNCQRCQND